MPEIPTAVALRGCGQALHSLIEVAARQAKHAVTAQCLRSITIDRVRGGIWKFKGVASVGDEVACEAELMCTMRSVG